MNKENWESLKTTLNGRLNNYSYFSMSSLAETVQEEIVIENLLKMIEEKENTILSFKGNDYFEAWNDLKSYLFANANSEDTLVSVSEAIHKPQISKEYFSLMMKIEGGN